VVKLTDSVKQAEDRVGIRVSLRSCSLQRSMRRCRRDSPRHKTAINNAS